MVIVATYFELNDSIELNCLEMGNGRKLLVSVLLLRLEELLD